MLGSFIAWLQGKKFSLDHIDTMVANSNEKNFKPFEGVDFHKTKKGPDAYFRIGLKPWMFAKIANSDKLTRTSDWRQVYYGNCFIYIK